MELDLDLLTPLERLVLQLRCLYQQSGFLLY